MQTCVIVLSLPMMFSILAAMRSGSRTNPTRQPPPERRKVPSTIELATRPTPNLPIVMLLPRILAPVRASIQPCSKVLAPASRALDAHRTVPPATRTRTLPFVRYASHQSQGRANGAKDGPGKRLGAKKSGGTLYPPPHPPLLTISTLPSHPLLSILLTNMPQANSSSPAISSSANAAPRGTPARTALSAGTTASTRLSLDT